ncbi:unnamed protein product, partial [Prunus brigantina]
MKNQKINIGTKIMSRMRFNLSQQFSKFILSSCNQYDVGILAQIIVSTFPFRRPLWRKEKPKASGDLQQFMAPNVWFRAFFSLSTS